MQDRVVIFGLRYGFWDGLFNGII